MRDVDSAQERREARLDLAAVSSLALFVVPPMASFWFLAAHVSGDYKPSPWVFFLLFAGWAVVWNVLAGFIGVALWLSAMRYFLPAPVLRRWALYGSTIPVLRRGTVHLCDRLLGDRPP